MKNDEPVAKKIVETNDEVVFFLREIATLNTRAEIIHPP